MASRARGLAYIPSITCTRPIYLIDATPCFVHTHKGLNLAAYKLQALSTTVRNDDDRNSYEGLKILTATSR